MRTKVLIKHKNDAHWEDPEVGAYPDEAKLKTILREDPALFPFDDARRPVVMVDEFLVSIGDAYGFIDLVGVSPTGAITIVECKLEKNPDIKRRLVGQLIEYAAALWGMSFEEFDETWQALTRPGMMTDAEWEMRKRPPLEEHMAKAVGDDAAFERADFRAAVEDNLKTGKFTLVVAVDGITEALERSIRYLSEHLGGHTGPDARVVAMELGYVAHGDIEVLMPRAVGHEMAERPAPNAGAGVPVAPDEPSFMFELRTTAGDWAEPIVRSLLDWAATSNLERWYGAGRKVGTMNFGILDGGGARRGLVTPWTSGVVYLQFDQLKFFPPFDSLALRQELLGRINAIDGVRIPERMAGSWPTIPYAVLRPEASLGAFCDAFDWALGLIGAEAGRAQAERR